MDLHALLHKRRYRRLGLALFAALMVHIGLVLTGNWGILFSSTPSNQDRVLTLTLENTTHEGLKETSLKEEDTVNEAKLGKAAESPKELLTETEPYTETKPQAKPEPVEEALASQNASQNDTPKDKQASPIERIEHSDLITEVSSSSVGNSDLPLEFITSSESEFKVVKTSPVNLENDQPILKELDIAEVEMLNKKVERWSSSVSKKLELEEPLVWEENGNQYAASFRKLSAETDMDTDEVVIEIATDRDGKKLTTSLRLKKMAFSNFAQFVHQWDSGVSVHNDEMNGRFHSNTRLNLVANRHGSPLFHGKVTTASYFVDIDGNVPRRDIFLAGIETGVKKISMPKPSVLFDEVQSNGSVNSTLIDSDSRLIFNPDGSYLLQAHDDVGVMRRYMIGEQPLYILAAPDVSLSISGTVNGAVAVYSPKRIIIEGNLEYLSTDHIDQGGDFLGLISGRNVVIAKRKLVPQGDLNIQAAIYAKNRFEVKQLTGKREGTLNILGSVSAGSITATEPRYATNIVFDTRLENLRPPGFPVTDRYELLAEKNSWQLKEDPFFESLSGEKNGETLLAEEAQEYLTNQEQLSSKISTSDNTGISNNSSEPLRKTKRSSGPKDNNAKKAVQVATSQSVEEANDIDELRNIELPVKTDEPSIIKAADKIGDSDQFENYSEG